MKVAVRFATSTEGPLLYRLYLASGKSPLVGVDWSSDPSPYWLIAELMEGTAVGCIQLRPSKPIGMLELLCIPTDTPYRLRARVVSALTDHGKAILRLMGIHTFAFGIDQRYPAFVEVAKRRGAVHWFHEPTYLMHT